MNSGQKYLLCSFAAAAGPSAAAAASVLGGGGGGATASRSCSHQALLSFII